VAINRLSKTVLPLSTRTHGLWDAQAGNDGRWSRRHDGHDGQPNGNDGETQPDAAAAAATAPAGTAAAAAAAAHGHAGRHKEGKRR